MSRRGAVLQDYGNINHTQTMEAQHNAAQYYQRDKELAAQERQNQQAAKQKEGKDAIDFIGGLKIDHVGDNTIDLYNDAQLQGLQKELVGMHGKGSSVQDIKIAAMQKLPKITQGYTIAKNEYAKIVNGVKDLTKDYPTGDMEAARNLAGNELLRTIFEYDDKGNIKGYKDPSLIPTDKNYMQNLTTNENLSKWYRKSGSFEKGIKGLPLIPIKGGTTRTDRYGKKVKQTFTGHGSVFDDPIMNDEGEQTGWQLKAETVPLGRNPDGSIIVEKVMPKEQFDMALSTPAAKLDFQVDFNKHLEETGVNPDELDPRARDILERKYAYDLLEKTGLHGSSFLTTDEIKEAPIKNITNVRVNTGKTEPPVMDIVTPVKDYFDKTRDTKKEGFKGIAQFNLFNNEVTDPIVAAVKNRYPDVTADDIYYNEDGKDIWVMKTAETGKINRSKDTPIFKLDEFSNVSGNKAQGQKSKNKALTIAQNTEKKEQPKSTAPSYSRAELKNSGWTDEQINKAVKAGKIKIN